MTKSLLVAVLIIPALLLNLAHGKAYTVVIEGMKFIPENLTVKVNDTVTWINKDFFPHTATAVDKTFNSRNIPANQTWTLKPKVAGELPYKCLLHPTMKGVLRVR